MSILIDRNTRLIVQGITGRDGNFHAQRMKEFGTKVVGGVSPGKKGQAVGDIPVFNTVKEAIAKTDANASIIFVPASGAVDAIYEAAEAGIKLIITITEGIPTLDMIKVKPFLEKKGAHLIGPNCPGLISPEEILIGIMPAKIFLKGNVGLISRSGTLTYEVVNQLTLHGIGQSTCIGIGGDPVAGLYYCDLLEMFENDPETEAIVMIGEIGGEREEKAAEYIPGHITKPIVAFIAGQSAPPDKRMGHAGAIISSGSGTAKEKINALKKAGVKVAGKPSDIPIMIENCLKKG